MRSLTVVLLVFSITPAPALADCKTRAAQLKQKLSRVKAATTLPIPPSFAAEAPRTALGAMVRDAGPVVGYDGTSFTIDGLLCAQDQLAATLRKSKPRYVYVAAGSALPVERLLAFTLLAPGAELRLLVKPAQDPKDWAPLYQDLADATGSCRPLRNALAEADGIVGEARWAGLREKVPAAVVECKCKDVDPEKLASALARLNDPAALPWRFQTFKLSPKGKDLKLPPGASLGQLLEALWLLPPAERAKPTRL